MLGIETLTVEAASPARASMSVGEAYYSLKGLVGHSSTPHSSPVVLFWITGLSPSHHNNLQCLFTEVTWVGPGVHVLEWCILSSECWGEPCAEDPSAYKQETWYTVETLPGLTILTPGVREPHSSLHCPGETLRTALF